MITKRTEIIRGVCIQAEEMAQTFRQRIAQAEAMARADMLRFQPEVCVEFYLSLFVFP